MTKMGAYGLFTSSSGLVIGLYNIKRGGGSLFFTKERNEGPYHISLEKQVLIQMNKMHGQEVRQDSRTSGGEE